MATTESEYERAFAERAKLRTALMELRTRAAVHPSLRRDRELVLERQVTAFTAELEAYDENLRAELKRWRFAAGFEDDDEFTAWCEKQDGSCEALCEEHCVVEPDGACPHGKPSILKAAGFI